MAMVCHKDEEGVVVPRLLSGHIHEHLQRDIAVFDGVDIRFLYLRPFKLVEDFRVVVRGMRAEGEHGGEERLRLAADIFCCPREHVGVLYAEFPLLEVLINVLGLHNPVELVITEVRQDVAIVQFPAEIEARVISESIKVLGGSLAL